MRAMIKVAPLVTAQALLRSESVEPGRILYEKGCFSRYIANRREPIAVWIDHDPQRVVGHVREFSEFDDVDGAWLAAHASLDKAPGWLKRGTAASLSFHVFRDQKISGWTRILDGLLSEVSILSPAVKPAESLARVVLVQDEEPEAARDEIIHRGPDDPPVLQDPDHDPLRCLGRSLVLGTAAAAGAHGRYGSGRRAGPRTPY